ncbi:LOW QUALITY PROTEIN: prenylcysteine oxidase 1 [Pterocles gutturalis]
MRGSEADPPPPGCAFPPPRMRPPRRAGLGRFPPSALTPLGPSAPFPPSRPRREQLTGRLLPPLHLLLLLAALCPPVPGRQPQHDAPGEIAVVGGGIGGAAAAYLLRQQFGRGVRLEVLEKAAVGGRLATLEVGGPALHPLNLHMKHFVKELGANSPLHTAGIQALIAHPYRSTPGLSQEVKVSYSLFQHQLYLSLNHLFHPVPRGLSVALAHGSLVGIYNGEEFVFEESSWYIVNLLKLLWRYGLNPLRMYMWDDILDKFMRISRYQTYDYAFSSNEDLLHALGGNDFPRMLNQTIDKAMQKASFSYKFINEMVCPAMRVNYGQGNINSFVGECFGVVSLSGVESGLWSVKGGNKLVCTGLLYASKAEVIPGTVLSIEPKTRPRCAGDLVKLYHVTYNTTAGPTGDTYDIIVIAAPLSRKMANIIFKNPPVPDFPNPYHQTVTTLVHGCLNASFWYRHPSAFHFGAIFTMENPKLFINSLGVVSPVENVGAGGKLPLQSAVWKVFSKEVLNKEQLNLLFSSYNSIKVKKWLAYPHYSPPEKCPPIILHDNIYYLKGIERAASAMEMSAITAKNTALLAYHRCYGNTDRIDQKDLHKKLKTEL